MTASRVTRHDRTALLILGALLIIRLAVALLIAPPVYTDAQGYEAAAFRLSETGSFAYPLMTSDHWAMEDGELVVTEAGRVDLLADRANAYTLPGFSAYRALIIKASGGVAESRVWTRLVQAILSVLTAGLIYLIGRRFGPRCGLIALSLSAVYPPFTTANTYLQTEVLFTFLLLMSVYWFVRWSESLSWTEGVAAGVVFGLSLWVRPAMALYAPLAAGVVALRSRPQRTRAFAQAAMIGVVILLAVMPWWVRNLGLYDRFVPFSTSGAITSIEAIRMDVAVQLPFPWQSKPPTQTAEQAEIEKLAVAALVPPESNYDDDVALNDHYRAAGSNLRATLMRDHFAAAASSRLRSIAVSLFWPFAVSPGFLGGIPFLISWIIHAAIMGLFAYGVILLPRRTSALLLFLLPAYTFLVHLPLIPFHRYYFPAMPVVMVIAAIGLDALLASARPTGATDPETM